MNEVNKTSKWHEVSGDDTSQELEKPQKKQPLPSMAQPHFKLVEDNEDYSPSFIYTPESSFNTPNTLPPSEGVGNAASQMGPAVKADFGVTATETITMSTLTIH